MRNVLKLASQPVLALMLATALAPIAAAGQALQVTSHTAVANLVMVTVANPTQLTQTGVVRVEVLVGGSPMVATKQVTVSAKSGSVVTVGFPGVVSGVIAVGMSTEGADPM